MKTITVNQSQKLYVFHYDKHYSCLGFDVCEKRLNSLAQELGVNVTNYPNGSIELYNEYVRLLAIAEDKNSKTGWRSKSELIPEFIGREGQRVEVIDCHGEKRRFYIGKSTGFIPCHLEILKSNSTGGGSVTGHPFKSITYLNKKR